MIITVSPSSISDLQDCPQKYNYSSMRRLHLIDEDRSALDRGTLFHQLLAMHYQLIIDGNKDQDKKLEYLQIMNAVREYGRKLAREDEFPIEMVEESISNYSDYAMFYQNDNWIPLEVEKPFSRELYSDEHLTILLEGRMDLIVDVGGQKFPVDHKTEAKKDWEPNNAILNNQFLAYCWATDSNNLVKNAIGFQKTYDPPKRMHRDVYSYDASIIEEWRHNIVFDVMQLTNFIAKEYYPRRYAACKFCRYNRICSSTPDARDFKIESQYKVGDKYDIFGEKK